MAQVRERPSALSPKEATLHVTQYSCHACVRELQRVCVFVCVPRAVAMRPATACVCVCVCERERECVRGLSYTHLEQLAWVQRRLAALMFMSVASLCCKQYFAAPPAGPYDALFM